ncbi:MAG: succinate dehydrogenase assembly factor 2 [Terricaulis sp.]
MDDRRKKLKFRAWRRGFREIDLILGPFADETLAEMDLARLDEFEALLDAPDHDLFAWIMEAAEAPAEFQTGTLRALQEFRLTLSDRLS